MVKHFLITSLLYTVACGTAVAAETVLKNRNADGGVVFSDVPLNAQGQRLAYTGQYGRKPAIDGCLGQDADSLARRRQRLLPEFQRAAQDTGLELELLTAVAVTESCFDTSAVSSAGARGIMQLMPETAAELGFTQLFDPRSNISAGAKYLAQMLELHRGNLTLALAAYNAGPGAVAKHGGVPPYPETKRYVASVKKQLARYRNSAG